MMDTLERLVVIEEFVAMKRNTLRGFCKVTLPSGMILWDVAVHVDSNGKSWASPAGRPLADKDGTIIRDPLGKVRYAPLVSFASKEIRDRFSRTVVEALQDAYPDALD